MKEISLEDLFQRYRTHADLRALSRVFDRTAPDLLGLARHLSASRDDADDLVQTTFLRAIERHHSFDRERRLVPWLVGILVREAASERRKQRRELDPERLPARSAVDPVLVAQALEVESEVQLALTRLPHDERVLLAPYLNDGQQPIELARQHGLAPGAMRMRIQRGLDRLRHLLPASLSAALIPFLLRPRLAHMRGTVLRAAAARSGVRLTLGIHALTGLGGLVMTKSTALAGLALGLALLVGLVALDDEDTLVPAVVGQADQPTTEALRAEVALVPQADEALESHESGVALAPASTQRTQAPRTGLWLHGRLRGVRASHASQVSIQVEVLAQGEGVSGSTRGRRAANADRSTEYARLAQDARTVFLETLAAGAARVSTSESTVVASATLAARRDGTFEYELSGLLARHSGTAIEALRVTASHELYFDGAQEVALRPGTLVVSPTAPYVQLDVELDLRPAAILRGEVVRAPAQRETLQLEPEPASAILSFDSGLNSTLMALAAADSRETYSALRVTFALTDFLSQSHGVALFRLHQGEPATEPQATARWRESGGTFELKVPEAGQYLVLAYDQDGRPASARTRLRLGQVTKLRRKLRIESGSELSGQCLAPAAGARVHARRLAGAGDVPIDLGDARFAWTGEAFEWRERSASVEPDGTFLIDALGVAQHEVWAEGEGGIVLSDRPQSPLIALAPSRGIVLAPEFASVHVRLTGTSRPADEGTFELEVLSADGEQLFAIGRFDDQGEITLVVPPEREYALRVRAFDQRTKLQGVVSPAAGEVRDVRLRCKLRPASHD